MRVHHLDCTTMCPLGGRWIDGRSWTPTARLVCHCLLLETNAGLVLVDTGDGWLLHAGDAYFFHAELDPQAPRCTGGLRLLQRILEMQPAARLWNQDRLRALRREHGAQVRLFCAHDALEFEQLRAAPGAATEERARPEDLHA